MYRIISHHFAYKHMLDDQISVNFLKRPGYLILVLKILEGRYSVVGRNRSLCYLIIVDLCFFEYLVSTFSFLWSCLSCLSLNLHNTDHSVLWLAIKQPFSLICRVLNRRFFLLVRSAKSTSVTSGAAATFLLPL